MRGEAGTPETNVELPVMIHSFFVKFFFVKFFVLAFFVIVFVAGCGHQSTPPAGTSLSPLPLAQARAQHPTKLLHSGPSPQPGDPEAPPDVQTVQFQSHGRTLFAWLAMPHTPGPHPGLLYAHGGFALGKADFDDVRPFVQAGYIVLTPAWRGEDGNPGDFQMLYGEVNDASAALDTLAQVPGVDKSRLFAAGHSVGGTTVMLLAESTIRLRGAAACGGFPDMRAAIAEEGKPAFEETPFDWQNPLESDLRSPARHLNDLSCPLSLFYGEEEPYYREQAEKMKAQAQAKGKTVTVTVFPGTDHFSALAPAVRQMIVQFGRE